MSPGGDDAGAGTAAKPVRTLPRAVELARAMRGKAKGDVTILLAGGTYRLSRTLELGPQDSGMDGHDLVFMGAPGQRPIVSGGVQVSGWTKTDAARNVWTAALPAGAIEARQIYVDGVRATRTRGRMPADVTMNAAGYDGHGGKNYDPLMISNNYWQQGDADSSKENVTEQGNHLINALAQVPAEVINDAGLQKPFEGIARERFAKAAAPEAPSRVAASGGDGFAYVTWSPSVQEGGSPVSEYVVRASNGTEARISNADFWKYTYLKMTGLLNGPLTFTVSAVNAQGRSVASLPTRTVMLQAETAALPGVPENVSVRAGKGAASIHFQLPADQPKGSPVLAYAVTVNPGGRKVMFTGRNIVVLEGKHATFNVVDGLTPGTAYTFSVAAVNDRGEGAPAVVGPVTIP